MQKYAVLYATYAEIYILHILHLYALPTLKLLIMSSLSKLAGAGPVTGPAAPGPGRRVPQPELSQSSS